MDKATEQLAVKVDIDGTAINRYIANALRRVGAADREAGGHPMSGPSAEGIVGFLRARLDEDEAWALGASSAPRRAATEGEHWHWQDVGTDDDIEPNPAVQGEYMDDDAESYAVALRSVELYPYRSIPGAGPHMVLGHIQEIEPAIAGHIARHDPARVLREVEAKRQIVDEHWPELGNCPRCVKEPPERDDEGGRLFVATAHPCATLRLLALPFSDHPDHQQEWKP